MRIRVDSLRDEPRSATEVRERARTVQKRLSAQRRAPRKPKPPRPTLAPTVSYIPVVTINPRTSVKAAVRHIIAEVASAYDIDVEALLSESRMVVVARPRMIAMWLTRQLILTTSLPKIGRHFHRDHSTVINAMKKITALYESDPEARAKLDDLRHRIALRFG